jgi:hypothetical protein
MNEAGDITERLPPLAYMSLPHHASVRCCPVLQGDAAASAWLLSSLLAALDAAVPQLLRELLETLCQQQQQAALAGGLQAWAQQQAADSAVASGVAPLTGLFAMGQELGVSHCRAAAAAGADCGSVLGTLHSITQLLAAACVDGEAPLLRALAGAVASGLCAGASMAMPAAAGAGAMAGSSSSSFDTIADAAWGPDAPTASQHQQQQAAAVQQQLQQQTHVLMAAVETACAHCLAGDSNLGGGAAAAAAAVGQLLLGHAYSKCVAHQQQQQQHVCWPGLLLSLRYTTQQCCSLAGVYHHAGICHDAAAANTWLRAQTALSPAHDMGVLVRWLAGAAKQLRRQQLLQLLLSLREAGTRLAADYSSYQQALVPAVAGQLDAAAVRQQLDKSFALHVALLSEAWQAANTAAPSSDLLQQQAPDAVSAASEDAADAARLAAVDIKAAVVAVSLSGLAPLQFCRVQVPAYVNLLMALVSALATSSAAADTFVDMGLPCYERLTALVPTPGASASSGANASAAVWQDAVVAAQLGFLLPLLPVAVRSASQPAAAASSVMPLLLLLLPHPQVPALAQAAHAAFAGLVAIAAEQQQPTAAGDALMQVVQAAVCMYISRTLAALPSCGSLDGFAAGFYSLLRNLPTGSVQNVLAVSCVADRAVELAQCAEAAGGGGAGRHRIAAAGSGRGTPPLRPREAARSGAAGGVQASGPHTALAATQLCPGEVATRLFELLVLAVQSIDYQLLPTVLERVSACLSAAPGGTRQLWLLLAYNGCLAVPDYTRKAGLMHWFDGVARRLRAEAGDVGAVALESVVGA